MGLGVRRERYFYWFVIDIVCVYGGVEEDGHGCNHVVLCVDVAIREFIGAERG